MTSAPRIFQNSRKYYKTWLWAGRSLRRQSFKLDATLSQTTCFYLVRFIRAGFKRQRDWTICCQFQGQDDPRNDNLGPLVLLSRHTTTHFNIGAVYILTPKSPFLFHPHPI